MALKTRNVLNIKHKTLTPLDAQIRLLKMSAAADKHELSKFNDEIQELQGQVGLSTLACWTCQHLRNDLCIFPMEHALTSTIHSQVAVLTKDLESEKEERDNAVQAFLSINHDLVSMREQLVESEVLNICLQLLS